MKGIIKITDKVRFVYYELPEPDENSELLSLEEFEQACENYYNSKREVEIENVAETSKSNWEAFKWDKTVRTWMELKNDLPCEAEVTDGKATIVKIL